jgi:hypothetical protein
MAIYYSIPTLDDGVEVDDLVITDDFIFIKYSNDSLHLYGIPSDGSEIV